MMTVLPNNIHRVVTCFLLQRCNSSNSNGGVDSNNNDNERNGNNDNIVRIGIFHRCDTMPSYPNHWAGISGSIEKDDISPLDAVQRELQEETNLSHETIQSMFFRNGNTREPIYESGVYVDVTLPPRRPRATTSSSNGNGGGRSSTEDRNHDKAPKRIKSRSGNKVIRVYPFAVYLPESYDIDDLGLRGTEHDKYQFVSVNELQVLDEVQSKCVPKLFQAFHHATRGKYDTNINRSVRNWSQDEENGATIMVSNAIDILVSQAAKKLKEDDDGHERENGGSSRDNHDNDKNNKQNILLKMAMDMSMLRPTMVPIVNVMTHIITSTNLLLLDQQSQQQEEEEQHRRAMLNDEAAVLELKNLVSKELDLCVQVGQDSIRELYYSTRQGDIQDGTSTSNKRQRLLPRQQNDKNKKGTTTKSSSSSSSSSSLTIATFSRSGTINKILQPLLFKQQTSSESSSSQQQQQELVCSRVICGKSTPGNEGILMARDLQDFLNTKIAASSSKTSRTTAAATVECVDDEVLHQLLSDPKHGIDLLIIGADCVLCSSRSGDDVDDDDSTSSNNKEGHHHDYDNFTHVINKVGTSKLCQLAQKSQIPVYCFADRWKIWHDIYPPPIETNLFELFPVSDTINRVVIPQQ